MFKKLIWPLLLCLLLLSGCAPGKSSDGGGNSGDVAGTVTDYTPPYTSGWSPAKSATSVARDTNIVAHIKDAGQGVDQATIVMTVEGATVTPVITGTVADYTLTYNPLTAFIYNQVVSVTVAASDLNGNVMTPDTYSFTCLSDTIPPTVSSTVPVNGATSVAVNSNVTVTFSEAMNASTINSSNIYLTPSTAAVVSYDSTSHVATLNPDSDLSFATPYTWTVSTSVQDVAGNTLVSQYEGGFSTGNEPDTTGPVLAITSHTENQHVTTASITLSGTASDESGIQQVTVNGSLASGTTNWSKDVSLNLGPNSLTVIVFDNSANHNQTSLSITIYRDDPTAPTVTNQNPASGATNVAINTNVYFEIDDNYVGVDIVNLNVTIAGVNAIVNGSMQSGYSGNIVSDGAGGFDVTINPDTDFAFSQVVEVAVTASDLETPPNVMAPLSYSFTCASNMWSAAASLPTAKLFLNTTLLSDGRVLVTGGYDNIGEIYTPSTNTWNDTSNMIAAYRYDHSATLLTDGRVLVTGGFANQGNLNSCETYDPSNNTWSAAASLATARSIHTATLLTDGKVLVTGGYNSGHLSSCELYNPITNTWSAATSMATARDNHTATLLTDGRVLVAGGNNTGLLSSCEIYDPNTNIWSPAASMAMSRNMHKAILLFDGRVLAVGGRYLSNCEVYDPSTNTWSPSPSMALERRSFTATLLVDGRVLVAGGDGRGNGNYPISCEIYNPSNNIWNSAANLIEGRAEHTATLLNYGRVLVVGGRNGSPLTSCEIFSYAIPPDSTAPAVSNCNPDHDQIDVPIANPIYLEIHDPLPDGNSASGVDRNTITVTVAGTNVVLDGIFQAGYSGCFTPDGLGGFDVTINSDTDFDYEQLIVVTVAAADLSANVMNQYVYSFTTMSIPDNASPYTSSHNPAKDASEVARNTDIVVHVQDAGVGVDSETIVMTVEGATVTPTITGSAADYTLTYNPPADFAYSQVVDVTLNASDLSGNAMSPEVYSFTCVVDSTPPVTSDWVPAKNATDIRPAASVVVAISDSQAGVDSASIVMTVAGQIVSPDIAGASALYTLSYDPPTDFAYDQVVEVTVAASDLNGNAMTVDSYSFTIMPTDVTAPAITNQNPLAATVNVPITTAIYFEIDDNYGVNLSTLNVTVAGVNALVSGALQEGYGGAILEDGTGGGYNISLEPDIYFDPLQVVEVVITASDIAGNAMTPVSFSFTCGTDGWDDAASLSIGRWLHTTTSLADGRILVTGGYLGSIYNTCEIYDPANNTWSAAANMSGDRYGHTATLLEDGRVLVPRHD